jgi:hypothetical protein
VCIRAQVVSTALNCNTVQICSINCGGDSTSSHVVSCFYFYYLPLSSGGLLFGPMLQPQSTTDPEKFQFRSPYCLPSFMSLVLNSDFHSFKFAFTTEALVQSGVGSEGTGLLNEHRFYY